jgi:tryptophan synthase alpha chain
MSRISNKFKELKENNKKALITFLTSGDPNLDVTKEIVKEMEIKGADIIELGVPYSDPIAEGEVIQRANVRALDNKIKISDIMNMVYELRNDKDVKVPLVYLLYFNCIYKFGINKFLKECNRVGIDGLIIPDLPFEEQEEILGIANEYDIDIITLVTPTSKDRIEKIAKRAKGFLYCVSSLGITGERKKFETDFDEFFEYINKYSSIPNALGFGISTPKHIKMLKKYSDALIVGTAIVKMIENSKTVEEKIENVGKYVKILKNALDS